MAALTSCAESTYFHVGLPDQDVSSVDSIDLERANAIVSEVASRFDFVTHPDEDEFRRLSKDQEWDREYIAAYQYAGEADAGRIYLFLNQDRHDGHIVVLINNLDAYGTTAVVLEVEAALLAEFAEQFPGRPVEIDRVRGVSPLGP